jgi:hypothetical protein
MTTKPAKPSKRWTVSTFRVVTCASTKPKNVAHLVAAAAVVVAADIAAAAAEIVVAVVAVEIVVVVAVAVVVTTAVAVVVIVAPITEVGKPNAQATFIQKARRKRRAFFCALNQRKKWRPLRQSPQNKAKFPQPSFVFFVPFVVLSSPTEPLKLQC